MRVALGVCGHRAALRRRELSTVKPHPSAEKLNSTCGVLHHRIAHSQSRWLRGTCCQAPNVITIKLEIGTELLYIIKYRLCPLKRHAMIKQNATRSLLSSMCPSGHHLQQMPPASCSNRDNKTQLARQTARPKLRGVFSTRTEREARPEQKQKQKQCAIKVRPQRPTVLTAEKPDRSKSQCPAVHRCLVYAGIEFIQAFALLRLR